MEDIYITIKDLNKINEITGTIKDVANKRLHTLYGENVDRDIIKRFEIELDIITGSQFEKIYMFIHMITNKIKADKRIVLLKGHGSSSLIVYLLGISEIKPIEYNIPFEMFSGINGDRTPYFELVVNPNYANIIYQYIKETLEKYNITYHDDVEKDDYTTFNLTISTSEYLDRIEMLENKTGFNHNDVNITDDEILKLFRTSEIDTEGLAEFDSTLAKKIITKVQPQNINDLIKVVGLINGRGIWEGNVENLLQHHNISELPCTRDDIFLYLIEKGLDRKDAFNIMKFARQGRGTKSNYEEEWNCYKSLMKSYNIPDWYISSIKKVKYMTSKSNCLNYLLNMLWLVWYKANLKN